jgi:membrane protein
MPKNRTSHDRGRGADRPQDIPAAGWKDVAVRTWQSVSADHVSVVSAGVAFFGLLAMFPALAAFVAIAGFVMTPAEMEERISTYAAALPEGAADIITEQAVAVAEAGGGAGWGAILGFALALWGASKGVKSLMEGMNIAYEEEENRGIVAYNLWALALTLFLIVGLILAVSATVVAPAVAAFVPLPGAAEALLTYAPWPALLLLTIFGLAVIYRYGPSRENARWRWITPGAIAATVLWLLGSIAFSVYVTNFGSYNATYGALGGVIVLLTWLWLSAFVVLLGAELNSEIEHQTARDTTTGEPRPMGVRGAEKADSVARKSRG